MEFGLILSKLFLLISSVGNLGSYEDTKSVSGTKGEGENYPGSVIRPLTPDGGASPIATPSDPRPFTVLVEGNVGSGKSTTLKYLSQQRSDIELVFEPVAKWQNVSGVDLLQKMFDSPKRWSGVFQFYSGMTRYENALAPSSRPIRIMERSIFSERYCFLEAMHDKKDGISDPEYLIMTKWFELMTGRLWDKLKPDMILYIHSSVPTLMERIRKRNRAEEAHMDPAFLEALQRKHDDWLLHKNSSFPLPTPNVKVLDGDLPLAEFQKYLKDNLDSLLQVGPNDDIKTIG